MLKEFSKILNIKFKSKEELLDYLSERLAYIYEECDDLQEAFNILNSDVEGLLNKYGMIYRMGSMDWYVTHMFRYGKNSDKQKALMIETWNKNNTEKVNSIDDICNILESSVMDIMSNVGCDAKIALDMISSELFPGRPFYIECGEFNQRVCILPKPLYTKIKFN